MSILLLTNCNKEAKQDPVNQGELVFAPMDITPDKDWICDLTLTVKYAHVIINGVDYYPLTFVIDGKLYTQAIKLDAGAYLVEYFALMDDMGTPDKVDDKIVKATPMYDSDYAQYVEYPLYREIVIVAFQKFELRIEVLCYMEVHYEYFGFFWFEVRELTIRTQCFFGDFCIKHLPDYYGSLYELDGLQLDEVAIFKIVATRNGDPIGTFHNTYWDDQQNFLFDSPLCVEYADYDNEEDHFLFELWIYVKVGNTFDYVLFHTWHFYDDEMIPTGPDWVVDFVLGNCNYTEPDLLLPPYMNLPWFFDFWVTTDNPNSYFNAHFDGIGPGYDIADGVYPAWCADLLHFITPGTHYNMCAFSSLYLNLLPSSCDPNLDWGLMHDEFGRLNWVFNNLVLLPPYNAAQMQDAIWLIMGFDVPGADATSLAIAALAAPHAYFSPLPGGWAAVLYFDMADCINVQITFRVVDP